jgi:hypothetical protein
MADTEGNRQQFIHPFTHKGVIMQKSLLVTLLLLMSSAALAQWSTNPNLNNPISMVMNNQECPAIVSNGSGMISEA